MSVSSFNNAKKIKQNMITEENCKTNNLIEDIILSEDLGMRSVTHTSLEYMKKQPDYLKAKEQMDLKAAKNVVNKIVKRNKIKELYNLFPNAVVVPIMSPETQNAIPLAFADVFKEVGFTVNTNIKQKNKIGRTKKGLSDRLKNRPVYVGDVIKDQQYIIIDDVITTGGSIISLKNYIEDYGGIVVAISTLTFGRPYQILLSPKEQTIITIKERYNELGYDINEILKTNGFDTLERMSNREIGYIKDCSVESFLKKIQNNIDK